VCASSAVPPEECNVSAGSGGCVHVLFGAVSTPSLASTGVEAVQQEPASAVILSSISNCKPQLAVVCASFTVSPTECNVSGGSGGWAIAFSAAGPFALWGRHELF